ncbi:hypothetical protein ACIOC1_00485 [Streptomyces sp. NPDC088197]
MSTHPEIRHGSCATCGALIAWTAQVDDETGMEMVAEVVYCRNGHPN